MIFFHFFPKKYFLKRNYLNGYLDFLRTKSEKQEIVIDVESRMPFGSLFIEGYSLVVWHPRKTMKILVTGSTGVIGQQLLKDLRSQYPESEITGTYYQIRGSNSDYNY